MAKNKLNIEKINWDLRRERLIELRSVYRAIVSEYIDEIPEYEWWDQSHNEDLKRTFPLAKTRIEKLLAMMHLYQFITWGDPQDEDQLAHYQDPVTLKIKYLMLDFEKKEVTWEELFLSNGYVDPNLRKQAGFTDIQKQVFQLKLLEKTDRQIADRLGISREAVIKHKQLISKKIDKCWKNHRLALAEAIKGTYWRAPNIQVTTKLGRKVKKARKRNPRVASWRK